MRHFECHRRLVHEESPERQRPVPPDDAIEQVEEIDGHEHDRDEEPRLELERKDETEDSRIGAGSLVDEAGGIHQVPVCEVHDLHP